MIFIMKYKNNFRPIFSTTAAALISISAACVTGCFKQSAPHQIVTATTPDEALALRATVEFIDFSTSNAVGAVDIAAFDFAQFPALTRLSLRGQSSYATLPDSFAALIGLRQLWLSGNEISEFPAPLTKLSALEYLNLDHNALTLLPSPVAGLTGIKWLRLNHNRIAALPDEMSAMRNIRKLYLRGNSFTNFPEVILTMTSLEELDLGDNKIATIPEGLVNLTNLSRIDLDGNPITALPARIGEMKTLRTLMLYNTSLPESEKQRLRATFPKPTQVFISQ